MVVLLDTNIKVSNERSDFDLNSIQLNTDGEKEKVDIIPKEDQIKLDLFEPNVVQCLEYNEGILQEGIISLDTIREAQLLNGYVQGHQGPLGSIPIFLGQIFLQGTMKSSRILKILGTTRSSLLEK